METQRQLLHISVGLFILVLRWLTWPQAAMLAGAAVLFNVAVLPRIAPRVVRESERASHLTSGLVLYPLAVLGLVLIFRERLELTAAAWAILAVGDGTATLVGVHTRTPALGWNRQKTLGGLAAFILFGSAAAIAALWWTSPTAPEGWMLTTAVMAAVIAGFAETVPISLNDNVTVPAISAAVLISASGMDSSLSLTRVSSETWPLLGLNVVVAALGWVARTVTPAGAVTGAIIGALVIAGTGTAGWSLLIVTFLAASVTTRVGHARKTRAGIAEERGGRRGAGNAIANTGVAAWAAFVATGLADPAMANLALVAALVTAGSDTVASEIGKAYGRTTVLVTSLRRVPPGTTGAVSLEGTVSGIVSAAGLAALGAWWGLVAWELVPVITAAATVASLIEGWLGATLEARGILNNDSLNFVNSAIGAGLALTAWSFL